jgi:hypothetical protein
MLGYMGTTPYLYYVLKEIDMTHPHIKSSWLTNGRMMVLVLFPNGVERVMVREKFLSLMSDGIWTL